jgi:hypothetical protein
VLVSSLTITNFIVSLRVVFDVILDIIFSVDRDGQ